MASISYDTGCRNCLRTDGIRRMYLIGDQDQAHFKTLTEFEIVNWIENKRAENNLRCEFCGSNNMEITGIEVGGYRVYDYNRLIKKCEQNDEQMFQLNIDKRGTQIDANTGGSEFISPDVFKAALKLIIATVAERPADQFKSNSTGNFFICITGALYLPNFIPRVRVETFRNAGITKEELATILKPSADRFGIPFNI